MVYTALPVEFEPDVRMIDWQVFRCVGESTTSDHFVGDPDGYGRVSSAIVEWNPETQIGTTRSGRTYHLVGDAAMSPVGSRLFEQWLNMYGDITHVTNVTHEYDGSNQTKEESGE